MIYTITCQRARNYGAVLQTWALARFLENMNQTVKVIDYIPEYLNQSVTSSSRIFNLIRSVIQFPDRHKGTRVFNRFLEQYIPLTPASYSSCAQMEQNLPPAEIYVAGSDQIWNMNCPNGNDDSYFLKFADHRGKKIAYAASFAMQALTPEQQTRVSDLTADFSAVSIREESGTALFKQATGKNACTVCDPVFLLTADEWKERMDIHPSDGEDYILVYAFYRQREVFDYARKLARKNNCKVYFINTAYLDFIMPCDKYFWCASPNTFLELLSHAKSVVTNSFHGVSFSLIFHKDVHVFYPPRKGNSRLKDILALAGMEDRAVQDGNLIETTIDYSQVDSRLDPYIQQSKEYLIHAVND